MRTVQRARSVGSSWPTRSAEAGRRLEVDAALGEPIDRVDRRAAGRVHLEVQVWAGGVARRADGADDRAGRDGAGPLDDARQVAVPGLGAVPVSDDDLVAVRAVVPCPDDLAGRQ